METRSNRIVIPFDDFYDQFNPDMPAQLQSVMTPAEFESCISVINKTITHKLLSSRRAQRLRLGILIVLGPIIVLLSGKGSVAAFTVPPSIFFVIFLGLAIYSYRQSMAVSQLAAGSIETMLRDLNKKHTQQGLTWRLHKKSTINEDFGFDDDNQTARNVYSYWIEIELLEEIVMFVQSNFSIMHENATPEKRIPMRAPPPPKSPMALPDVQGGNASSSQRGPPPATPTAQAIPVNPFPSQPAPSQPLLSLDGDDSEESVL